MTYDLLKPGTVEALVNAVTKDGEVREAMNLLGKLPIHEAQFAIFLAQKEIFVKMEKIAKQLNNNGE